MPKEFPTFFYSQTQLWLLPIAVNDLHQEDVLVAVVPEHVVIHLGHDPVLVLPIEEPDVGRVDFVLVLYCPDETVDSGRDQVEGRVHILQNIKGWSIHDRVPRVTCHTSVSCLT